MKEANLDQKDKELLHASLGLAAKLRVTPVLLSAKLDALASDAPKHDRAFLAGEREDEARAALANADALLRQARSDASDTFSTPCFSHATGCANGHQGAATGIEERHERIRSRHRSRNAQEHRRCTKRRIQLTRFVCRSRDAAKKSSHRADDEESDGSEKLRLRR